MDTKEYYIKHKQYGNRYDTDAQHMNTTYERKFKGTIDKQAKFIEEN